MAKHTRLLQRYFNATFSEVNKQQTRGQFVAAMRGKGKRGGIPAIVAARAHVGTVTLDQGQSLGPTGVDYSIFHKSCRLL